MTIQTYVENRPMRNYLKYFTFEPRIRNVGFWSRYGVIMQSCVLNIASRSTVKNMRNVLLESVILLTLPCLWIIIVRFLAIDHTHCFDLPVNTTFLVDNSGKEKNQKTFEK